MACVVRACMSVCSGPVSQTSLKRLKIRTSNLTCMFPGWTVLSLETCMSNLKSCTVFFSFFFRHDLLKIFRKGGICKNSLGKVGGDITSAF